MPRPRGGDWLVDEIRSLRVQRVDVLVSLLTREETAELHLEDEEAICEATGIQFLSFPVADRSVPENCESARAFAQELSSLNGQSKKIVIHCRAGIGRASLMAAAVLALQGFTVEDAFRTIAKARGCTVPDTVEQSEWVASMCKT